MVCNRVIGSERRSGWKSCNIQRRFDVAAWGNWKHILLVCVTQFTPLTNLNHPQDSGHCSSTTSNMSMAGAEISTIAFMQRIAAFVMIHCLSACFLFYSQIHILTSPSALSQVLFLHQDCLEHSNSLSLVFIQSFIYLLFSKIVAAWASNIQDV